jgi:hypothetical protein
VGSSNSPRAGQSVRSKLPACTEDPAWHRFIRVIVTSFYDSGQTQLALRGAGHVEQALRFEHGCVAPLVAQEIE